MTKKTILAFQYVVKHCEFDYMVRVNSSCYVDKKRMVEFVETLPDKNVFAGSEVKDVQKWMWGGAQFIYSRDVVEAVACQQWDTRQMEDVAVSRVVNSLGIPYTKGLSCSINKRENDWLLIDYPNGNNKEFVNFDELKDTNQFFFRVKCDGRREIDKYVMQELFKVL